MPGGGNCASTGTVIATKLSITGISHFMAVTEPVLASGRKSYSRDWYEAETRNSCDLFWDRTRPLPILDLSYKVLAAAPEAQFLRRNATISRPTPHQPMAGPSENLFGHCWVFRRIQRVAWTVDHGDGCPVWITVGPRISCAPANHRYGRALHMRDSR